MEKKTPIRRTFHLVILAMGALVSASMATESAWAQAPEEITVTAPRAIQNTVGRGPTGISIQEISLSYQLSYADLDLTKTAGVSELDRRIKTIAKEACKALNNLNPLNPKDPRCVTNAINGTADQRKHAIAAATAR
jgi:UrcA family protein